MTKILVAVPLKAPGEVYLAVEIEEDDAAALGKAGVAFRPQDQGEAQHTAFGKHGTPAVLVPLFAGVPDTAVIIGAATLGLVGGAAGTIGSKIANWAWPDKAKHGLVQVVSEGVATKGDDTREP